jgi:hypothetical protein
VETYENMAWNLVGVLNETHGENTVRSTGLRVQLCMSDAMTFQTHVQQFDRFFTGTNFHFFHIADGRSTALFGTARRAN